jgi:hypothetical protein
MVHRLAIALMLNGCGRRGKILVKENARASFDARIGGSIAKAAHHKRGSATY